MDPGKLNRIAIDEHARSALAPGAERTRGFAADARPAVWDSIIVGSSPLLLLEAIYLGRTGRKVLVLEERDSLGGAWGHLDNEEFPCLDVGCHYIDVSRRAYEFLRSNFDLNLVPSRPQPRFVYHNIRFPYDYKQLIRFIRHLRVAFRRRSLAPLFTGIFNDENYRLRMFPFTKTFLFPRGGSHELITKLTAHARLNNVTIRKRMRVESIRFDRKRQKVMVGAGGECFETSEIVAGSQARVTEALSIKTRLEGTQRRVFTHVILIFRDRSAPGFSYIRFLRHHALIRMTDITDQVRLRKKDLSGHRVICIGIRENYDRSMGDAEKIGQLTELLKKYRFIDQSATCVRSYWSRYPAEFLSNMARHTLLRDFSPMIRLLSTTNLSTGIVRNLDRWEQVFAPNSISSDVSRTTTE